MLFRILGHAIASDLTATMTSTGGLTAAALADGKGPAQPLNATSHIVYGNDAAHYRDADIDHTIIGRLRRHGGRLRWCGIPTMVRAVIMLAMISVPVSARGQTQPAPEMSERRRIVQSLATACRDFPDDKWAEADACRRAWFAEHEEAIWRLDLTPLKSAFLTRPGDGTRLFRYRSRIHCSKKEAGWRSVRVTGLEKGSTASWPYRAGCGPRSMWFWTTPWKGSSFASLGIVSPLATCARTEPSAPL